MFEIKVISHFDAAHRLRGYKGKCEELHGHNWKVELVLACDKQNKLGMVLDFTQMKKSLNNVLSALDHKYLNNIAYFKKSNPTSENIAKYIFDRLKAKSGELKSFIKSITVWESETSCATYYDG